MVNKPGSVLRLKIAAETVDIAVGSVPEILHRHSHTVDKRTAIIFFGRFFYRRVKIFRAPANRALSITKPLRKPLVIYLGKINTAVIATPITASNNSHKNSFTVIFQEPLPMRRNQ